MTIEEKSDLIRAHCDSIGCYECPLDNLNGKNTCYLLWREFPEEIERNYDLIFGNTANSDEEKTEDMVNHPSHYTSGGIECIDAIKASMTADGFANYCKGNVMKYIWRWRDKGGVQDLEKARVYLSWMIDTLRKGEAQDDTLL